MSARMPTYFLSHGGGPWPWMKDEAHGAFDELERSLKAIPSQLPEKPKAILVVTGHWIESVFAVSGHPKPGMIYDFGGFPAHTYHVKYPAPGSPDLASRIHGLLQAAGVASKVDPDRGFDHGTYTTTFPMYPSAEIPVVQLSIQRKFDPELHLSVGRVLAPLRSEGVLILGSGLSYHNLGLFGPGAKDVSTTFDRWLQETMAAAPEERSSRLRAWSQAPDARKAHPREDHLLPLMVAVGAAEGEPATVIYHEDQFFGGIAVSSYRVGA